MQPLSHNMRRGAKPEEAPVRRSLKSNSIVRQALVSTSQTLVLRVVGREESTFSLRQAYIWKTKSRRSCVSNLCFNNYEGLGHIVQLVKGFPACMKKPWIGSPVSHDKEWWLMFLISALSGEGVQTGGSGAQGLLNNIMSPNGECGA